MNYSRRDFTRYAGYAAAGAVVAAPIALAAATWAPLESPPRVSRANDENVADPTPDERRPRDKDQKKRPNREERKSKDST